MSSLSEVPVGTVTGCWRYPVKSLQGLSVDSLVVDPTGVDGDRAFGLIDVETGRLLSAKRVSSMLHAGADDHAIALPDGTTVELHDQEVHRVLSTWLGREVRLVAAAEAGAVAYEMTFDPPDDDAEYYEIPAPPGSVVDLAPVHLVATATLDACATARPDLDWDVRRFRPNLVLDVDVEPWGEQDWVDRQLAVGTAVLTVNGPTVRCAMPLRAQPGVARQPEIFAALSGLNPSYPNHLGLYCDVAEAGRVELGDTVTLL